MSTRIVKTVLPSDGVFAFEAIVRREGDGGRRIAIPAAIVRGLVHVGWTGRWLDVTIAAAQFRAAVRPHPTSVMFGLPRRHCQHIDIGDCVAVELRVADGPRAPRSRRVRGEIRPATPSLALPWLNDKRKPR